MTRPLALLRSSRRRGFALIFALTFLLLLIVLLIAAQGSVMTSTRLIQRSNERMDQSELASSLVGMAAASLRAGQSTNESSPAKLEVEQIEGTQTFKLLQPGDAAYSAIAPIQHREGDALVSVTIESKGVTEERAYLINPARRSGAVRVR